MANLKIVILLFCFVNVVYTLQSQKRIVDNDTYKNWERLGSYEISNDGKYCMYQTHTYNDLRYTVCNIKTGKKFYINTKRKPSFSVDSGVLQYFVGIDSLATLNLADFKVTYETYIKSFKSFWSGSRSLMLLQSESGITIKDAYGKMNKSFAGVDAYCLNAQGTALVLKDRKGLSWISLPTLTIKRFVDAGYFSSFKFSPLGNALAFIKTEGKNNEICFYTYNDSKIVVLADTDSLISDDAPHISDEIIGFSNDGRYVYFKEFRYRPKRLPEKNIIAPRLDIWHYKDMFLHPYQAARLNQDDRSSFTSVVGIDSRSHIIRLETETLSLVSSPSNNHYVLLNTYGNDQESFYNKSWTTHRVLVRLEDGTIIKSDFPNDAILSNSEKYVLWFDADAKNYKTYNIASQKILCVGSDVQGLLYNEKGRKGDGLAYGVMGWLKEDKKIFVYDKYDIWQIDPTGTMESKNITNGYGRKNNIIFRLTAQRYPADISPKETLVLRALDETTMDNGFWLKKTVDAGNPIKGNMGPYLMSWAVVDGPPGLVKSKNAKTYLITQQTASEAPNLFVTHDLRTYRQLTDFAPQRNYCWLTSELITWPLSDGSIGKGILYKPEKFDISNKYPVIFNYYETRSEELHLFKNPGTSPANINIPLYVSNGYIVFVPDIVYDASSKGKTGKKLVITLESAVKYLISKYTFIDPRKIGLQGQSFGGYETNYIITHSNLFAAANACASIADPVSWYGDYGFGGLTLTDQYELGQANFGGPPWQIPDVFVENSPIFHLDKVNTPLLLQHGRSDGAVNVSQAIEMYIGLRRLQKPVWLLIYDTEHVIERVSESDRPAGLDFAIRQKQFFDHYLQDKPAPVWMVEGISVMEQNFRSGLELDTLGRTP